MATTHPRTPAQREIKQTEIISLQRAGHSNYDIAERLGIHESTVRYHQKAWVASKEPPAERAHELREAWYDRLEVAHQKNWPLVMEGDAKAIEVMLKIQAQAARLFGLDLQPGMPSGVMSREALVAFLGLDGPIVIEGTAEEITDGS